MLKQTPFVVARRYVVCHVDKLPEPRLNFHWDATQGFLRAPDVTATRDTRETEPSQRFKKASGRRC
jgi:hypothetical protein